jgi:type IV pilus assembly protein PilQ
MRQIQKVVSTGCLFFCLGGWVYDGKAIAADEASRVKEAILNAAVASAATGDVPATAPAAAPEAAKPDASPAAPQDAPADNAATKPAGEGSSTNLNSAVVNVGVDGQVEQFNVQDMDINLALHFLSLQTKRNIIASKEVKGSVTANLYNVTFSQALDSLLKPNGFDYIEKGNFIYVYTNKELEDIRKRDRKTVNRIFRLHYMTAADTAVLIKPMLSGQGVIALTPPATIGLPDGLTDTGGMSYSTDDTLVINDYPENLTDVDKAIKQMDVRPKQVLVESTILNATLTENNALGIDFISLSGVDFSTLSGGAFTSNVNGSSSSSGSGSGSGTVLNGPNGIFNQFLGTKTQTNVGTDFASKVPEGGLSIGFLSNNIALFLRALEETTDTTIVANPKLLTVNKAKAEVFIGKQSGYKTTTTSSTTTQETVNFLDTGTKLLFRPFIGDDGYIRMEVHPEVSTGGVDASTLPTKSSTEVTSNIMVKDGRTVVIGGLFSETTTAGRGQVPILGNIPVLGVPFRRTNDATERTEMIVLLTPHVINDDSSLYEESEKQATDVNRQMLGNRAGLQPWGRDRIAQLWYGKAQEAYENGCPDKALMYIDWALNTNARFIEAIKLRERITNKRMQEPDSSAVSSYVRDILKDDAATTPDSGGAGHYPPATPIDNPSSSAAPATPGAPATPVTPTTPADAPAAASAAPTTPPTPEPSSTPTTTAPAGQ